jgi:formylglycine-generating enzyme required for sulfatase activity
MRANLYDALRIRKTALRLSFILLLLPPFLAEVFPIVSYAAPAAPGAGDIPSKGAVKKPTVSPSLLYEAVSGYLDGFKKAAPTASRSTPDHQHRIPVKPVPGATAAPRDVVNIEESLVQRRMQRKEWGLAVSSLDRILHGKQRLVSAAETRKLEGMLRTSQEKAARVQEQSVPGETVNSIGMRMVLIPAGTFEMGSSSADTRRIEAKWNVEDKLLKPETPNHKVHISRPFLMGKYPVTVADFKKFVSDTGYRTTAEKQGWGWVYSKSKKHWEKKSGASWANPETKLWDDHPVTMVSYQDADAFCKWLSLRENRRYYLPTEAQWEYAARGGKQDMRFPWGNEYPDGKKCNIADRRSDLPWADRTIDDGYATTSPVGIYEPNGFWLYDMAGNVWQYCSDYYNGKPYDTRLAESIDPTGPRSGKSRVVRGGNWAFGAGIARNAFRFGLEPDVAIDVTGFRVASTPTPSEEAAGSSQGAISNEKLAKIMDRVKSLVAGGRRLEAQKLVDSFVKDQVKAGDTIPNRWSFVQNVLQSLLDTSKDKKPASFTNSVGMKMVRIPAGDFVMGSSESDIAWAMNVLAQGQPVSLDNEYPFHKVRISSPFYIAATEVTVAQFRKFVEETGYVTDAEDEGGGQVYDRKSRRFEQKAGSSWKNPGWTVEPDQPVVMVSWNDAQAFAEWLAAKEKLPYKLPTEAQFEYAARGGTPMAQFPWGDALPDGRRANYADKNKNFEWSDRNADCGYKYVAPVGSYEANGFGLYDMAGNVLEWVRDYYSQDYYRYSPEIDPEGPGHGEYRVMKGGEWTFGPVDLRCAFRGWARPDMAVYNGGFRVAIELATGQHMFHFGNDFLTKEWVPGPDQRAARAAVSKEMSRTRNAAPPANSSSSSAGTDAKAPEEHPVRGLLIIDFTPKSDARRAGLQRGDVIVEYHGHRDLTADEFISLTALTKRQKKVRPTLVFVREGREYAVRVSSGILGISVMDTTIQGGFKKTAPTPEKNPGNDKERKSKHLDWT